MRKRIFARRASAAALAWMLAMMPLAAIGQTRVSMPKNKYKVEEDVKLGRDYSRKIEQQFPLLNDRAAEDYVEKVGQRLVDAIPAEFRQPAFVYDFDVVNSRDINAFALPGGPMYVNRGMIEAAKNEGEMAGVMAHEIAHVALRHATAQATKQSSFGNQLGVIGLILGGAVLGGQSGAQLGAIGAQAWMTKYSRDYETQADLLGSQIMANAGYDPRDLANMFQTISQQGGGRGPEFLSSHPDPGNRHQNINREASRMNVSATPIKITPDFRRVQERLRGMERAPSMAEIQRGGGYGGSGRRQDPTAGGRYSRRVEYPSSSTRVFNAGSAMTLEVPSNWRDFANGGMITFAPEGAYGDQGITHGAMVGASRSNERNLNRATDTYIRELLQANTYLRQSGSPQLTRMAGRQAYATVLSGRSPVNGDIEIVTVYTTLLRSGDLFYVAAVSPQSETASYDRVFRDLIASVQVND